MKRWTVIAVSVLVCGFDTAAVRGQGTLQPLPDAAAAGDLGQIKQYIEQKADLDAPDGRGIPPLKRAVESYQLEAVKLLLQGGANPNVKDIDNITPLMFACMTGQKEIAEVLLAAKADHSAKDRAGRTALHCAVSTGQIEAIELLIKAGADVNATDTGGRTPLSVAEQMGHQDIAALLKQHGGTLPAVVDPYAMYAADAGGASAPAAMDSRLPEGFVIDANAIREQLQKTAALQAPLKTVDANSEGEQRAWILRRSDNRTLLLRAVQKQFEDEMVLVKRTATGEKATKTTQAVDNLVTARKKRYQQIGQDLRDQRRQTLQESRDTMTSTRGRTTRGRSSTTGTGGMDPYGTGTTQVRMPRRAGATEPNEPALDADTKTQVEAWLNTRPEDKSELLKATHDLDVVEYAALHKSATEEKAEKTGVAIMALLMLRQERIAKIQQRWVEDDERMLRQQERVGPNGTPGMQPGAQPGTQPGMRRGRR